MLFYFQPYLSFSGCAFLFNLCCGNEGISSGSHAVKINSLTIKIHITDICVNYVYAMAKTHKNYYPRVFFSGHGEFRYESSQKHLDTPLLRQ